MKQKGHREMVFCKGIKEMNFTKDFSMNCL